MRIEQIDEMITEVKTRLLNAREPGEMWRGHLSSSAISTSVSVFALYLIDKEKYGSYIEKGASWLKSTMTDEGAWGDSEESPANMTATLLSYAALFAVDTPPQKARKYLQDKLGGDTEDQLIKGVLDYYGTDLTFSVPILAMCGLAGVISQWSKIPPLPFELAVLPQKVFRFLQLPVVSYAIPALIAVGILRYKKGERNFLSRVRDKFIPRCLKVLVKLQPADGGFLEAAPLTAFVGMCMSGAGFNDHVVTQKAAQFLVETVREDGAWPIDTDLASWVTSLSLRALDEDIPDREYFIGKLKANALKEVHPFTGAQPGGWGWTDLSGSVPDADDTPGALIALHVLTGGIYSEEIGNGIRWLMDLQNHDGGIPTFCKGWTKLPFDQSSPDLTAHTYFAFEIWKNQLPADLYRRCERSSQRLVNFMERTQTQEGAWVPLWFGDQQAADEHSPVYGTATAVDYFSSSENDRIKRMAQKGLDYLLSVQNTDGGWGGAKGVASKVTLTARTLAALAQYGDVPLEVIEKGFDFLYQAYRQGNLYKREPIGLYFARLWYSEDLYNITFLLNALKRIKYRMSDI
ncbi:MAG: squalene--hopene cyclase [Bacteroidaceae bacterium]|nr:squalene--hopene cyclase [Bacteroidaceae bacterium]